MIRQIEKVTVLAQKLPGKYWASKAMKAGTPVNRVVETFFGSYP